MARLVSLEQSLAIWLSVSKYTYVYQPLLFNETIPVHDAPVRVLNAANKQNQMKPVCESHEAATPGKVKQDRKSVV